MTHAQHSSAALFSPGDLIASMPGLLGYYPNESLIIISLMRDSSGTEYLGPVMRTDLSHARCVRAMIEDAASDDTLTHLAVVVSRIPNSPLVAEAVSELYDATDPAGYPLVDACWHVSEIAAGTPYCLLFGPAAGELGRAGLSEAWLTGTVASVVAQPTMGPLLAQGALPELDRSDTRAFFDPEGTAPRALTGSRRERIYDRGMRMNLDALTLVPAVRAEIAAACSVLEHGPADPFIGTAAKPRLGQLSATDADIDLLASVLTRSRLRDCLFTTALRHPHEAASVLMAVARESDGVIRANALSIWAVIAVHLQLGSWATAALVCAQEAVPKHSLSSLLLRLLRCGEHKAILETARRGCEEMWAELQLPPQEAPDGDWPGDAGERV